MRFWDKAVNPDLRTAHSHGRTTAPISGQFGQRPMFSRSDEEQKPEEVNMASEARLEEPVPIDESPGSKARAELYKETASNVVIFPYSTDNVGFPPTKAQIVTAFGNKPVGWTGVIIDGGGTGTVWFIVRSKLDSWWHNKCVKAL